MDKLNHFLKENEARAYRMAQFATNNNADALDLVQEAMMKLVKKYSQKPEEEWPPLFHRILQHQITSWHRRKTLQRGLFGWFKATENNSLDDYSNMDTLIDPRGRTPDQLLHSQRSMNELMAALNKLSLRQRQAFLLRHLQGLDTQQTATVMHCSQGSVKTHYHRALTSLRGKLKDYNDV